MDYSTKEEWIDGTVMMSPRPSSNHMEVEFKISMQLDKYFLTKCKVAIQTSLWLTNDNVVELKSDELGLKRLLDSKKGEVVPDIAVYCDKNQRIKRGYIGVPNMVVEVLSPTNSSDDTEIKKETYRKYGIPEYWIADPMTKKIFVYILEDETYKMSGIYNFLAETVKSAKYSDLRIDIKDIDLYEDEEE